MDADVAFAQCAENRVGNRMGQRVRIGVALGAAIGTDMHASQHKRPPFYETMRVVADPDPQHTLLCRNGYCVCSVRSNMFIAARPLHSHCAPQERDVLAYEQL